MVLLVGDLIALRPSRSPSHARLYSGDPQPSTALDRFNSRSNGNFRARRFPAYRFTLGRV